MAFVVEIKVNGKWERPLSSMPRSEAKIMAKWFRTYAKNVEKTRVIPTFNRT